MNPICKVIKSRLGLLAAGWLLLFAAAPALAAVEVTPVGGFVAGYQTTYNPGDIVTVTLAIRNTNPGDSEITALSMALVGVPPISSSLADFGDITITRVGGGVVYGPIALPSFGTDFVAAFGGLLADRTVATGATAEFLIEIEVNDPVPWGRFNIRMTEVMATALNGGDVTGDNFTAGPFTIDGIQPTLATLGRKPGKSFSLVGSSPVIGIGATQQVIRFWLRNQGDPAIADEFIGCTITFTDIRGFTPRHPQSSLRDLDRIFMLINGDTIKTWTMSGGPDGSPASYFLPLSAVQHVVVPANSTEAFNPVEVTIAIQMSSSFGYAAPGEAGGVIPGDAFIVAIDSYTQEIDVVDGDPLFTGSGSLPAACVTRPIHEVIRFPDTFMMVASSWRDNIGSGLADGVGLDRIAWFPVFGLHAISGPALPTRMLDRIDLRIVGPRADRILTANSPFAPVDGFTATSGLQVRKNTAGQGVDDPDYDEGTVGEFSEDEVSFTSRDDFDNDDMLVNFFWSNPSFGNEIIRYAETEVVVRLNFAGVPGNEQARSLPTTGFKRANTPFDSTRGTKPDFWIGIIPSDTSFFGETFVFSIDSVVIGTTPWHPDPVFQSPSNALVGIPVIFENLIGEGQFLAANSPAQAMAGFSAHDARHGAHLSAAHFYVLGDSGLSFADFLPMNAGNPESSGFAIYRDADGVAGNSNGVFDRQLDLPIQMLIGRASFEALPNGSIHTQFGAENGFRVFIEFDTQGGANPRTRLPTNNVAAGSGSDFFVAMRTSSSATTGRRFRIVFGEMEENDKDNISGHITFETHGPTLQAVNRVFSRAFIVSGGDTYRYGMPRRTDEMKNAFYRVENNFRTSWLTVGGAIGATYVEQIAAPRTVYPGDSFAAFGINAFAGTPLRINSVLADVIAGTTGFDSRALRPIPAVVAATSVPGGVAFYVDTGIDDTGAGRVGKWNVGRDPLAPAQIVSREVAGTLRCTFVFIPTLAVPTSDSGVEAGSDFFVALWLSDSALFQDSFYVRMPDSAIVFSDPASIVAPPMMTTPLLTVGMPFRVKPVLARTTLPIEDTPLAVLGFSAQDTTRAGDGGVSLVSVVVDLDDVGGTGFSLNSLAPLTTDSTSGVALWYDRDSDGVFNPALDTPILLSNISASLGRRVTLTVAGQEVPDIDGNFAHETRARFFVALRANAAAGPLIIGHRFTAALPLLLPGGAVQFTAPVNPNLTLTTSGIEIASAAVNGVFTPAGYGRNSTASLSISVGTPDSWFIRFYNRNADTVPIHRFPASGVWRGSTDTLVLNLDLGPRTTGVYNVELIYYDLLNQERSFGFGGQTLTVDSFAVPPSYDSAFVLATPTTAPTIDLNVRIDTAATTWDSAARLFSEATATVQIYRTTDTAQVLAGTGTLSNYRGAITVDLQSGVNHLHGVTTDSFGNRSETVFITAVQRNVGANVLEPRRHPEFRSWIEAGETIPVLSINLTQNASGEVINAIRLVISESVPGAFAFGRNIASVTNALAETAGIQLWRDRGTRGAWDAADQRIRLAAIAVTEGTGAERALLTLIPEVAIPVPPNDTGLANENLGDDLFIAICGGNALFRDSFFLHLPPGAFSFGGGGGRSNVTDTLTAGPIVTRVARAVTAVETAVSIHPGGMAGTWAPIFAFDLNDSTRFGDGGAWLSGLDLVLSDSNAYLLEFRLFQDNRGADTTPHGRHTADDTAVATDMAIHGGTSLSLAFPGNPAIPSIHDTALADFFLAVRVNPAVERIEHDIPFMISIPKYGISTSGDGRGGPAATPAPVTIKSGEVAGLLIGPNGLPRNYFNPHGRPGGDTLGFVIAPGLPRRWRVLITAVAGGAIILDQNGYADSAIVIISSTTCTGLAAIPAARWMGEYRLYHIDTVLQPAGLAIDTATMPPTALLYIDSEGLPLRVTKSSQTGATLIVDIALGDGGDLVEKNRLAAHRAERDSFTIRYQIRSFANVTRETGTVSGRLGTENSITLRLPITVLDTDAHISFVLIDNLGNVSTETRFTDFGVLGAAGAPEVRLGIDNEPVFRWTPANPDFPFVFQEPVADGRIEILNSAGRRIAVLRPDGSSQIVWRNAANEAGRTVRSGVYFVQFKDILLANGRRINGTGAILLLK